jgi:uncharacterized protein YegJ (DUF2314 family)
MAKKYTLPLLLCVFFFFSCDKQPVSEPPAETIQLDRTDAELQRIAENARSTLPSFFRHLARPGADVHSFCIKYPFISDDGAVSEQLWLTGIRFKNGAYFGTLANAPQRLNKMKKGDTVSFSTDLITDWMYVREGKIIGGYSIKYLLEKTPEEQRSEEQRRLLQMF